jgi:hypothetical protein
MTKLLGTMLFLLAGGQMTIGFVFWLLMLL